MIVFIIFYFILFFTFAPSRFKMSTNMELRANVKK